MTHLPAILQSGALAALESAAHALVLRETRNLTLAPGERAFVAGEPCHNYLIVTRGSLRVSVTTEEGREIVLYRVEPGETCVLTVSCLMSGALYDAEGVAEAETEALVLPKRIFEELIGMSPKFRRYVFASYGERLHGLIALVQEITLRHVDRRLARYLAGEGAVRLIETTHQAIATELNTAREVVTRLLGEFASRGWVQIERGRIQVKDPGSLAAYAGSV
ncbi:MAG: Crp/Fnr family transcriptional regulator [Aestuariivirga sp.]